MSYIFTSESVSAGHPDKIADQISDALLDAALERGDETTRVAIETLVSTNSVVVAGEVKNFNLRPDEVVEIIRTKIRDIGYDQPNFHFNKVQITNLIHAQSGDIGLGTDDFGAGDQGIMFGYACNETPSLMPAPIHYSHEILKAIDETRELGYDDGILGPDAKSQVSFEYTEDKKPLRATAVVVSVQHKDGWYDQACAMAESCARGVLGDYVDGDTVFHINPTGNFVIGGPDGDAGVTGRKIIVDTYGGYAPHGGGAFSGKDPTKVDRSGAYMARFLAKKAVSMGMCNWCTVQLSYAIGVKEPMAVYIDTDGDESVIRAMIDTHDLTPLGIIRQFDMFNFTNYSKECVYGHFGDKDVPWEKV